jgi:hypothetical protein
MPNPIVISISEFVEPRDYGEICVTVGSNLIARKSNIRLYGDSSVIVEFIKTRAEALRPHLAGGVVFENVDPEVAEKVRGLLE